jgi:threonine/homoserine/homoserine lactone efflux protein
MESLWTGAALALWLGVLTSISPCPLATNVTAMSFIGRQVERRWVAVISSFTYVVGRVATYVVLGALLTGGLLSVPAVSHWLQKYMNMILGPLLIVVGVFLTGLIEVHLSVSVGSEKLKAWAARGGPLGSALLGVLFALSFCPVSAALFFGRLVPLCLEHRSYVVLPLLYGAGTGLPVQVFAVILALAAHRVGAAYNALTKIETWARRVTGGVFIAVGVYYCLKFVFGVVP